MKRILFSIIASCIAFSAYGQVAVSPSKLTAKNYDLYDGATKLDAQTLEAILDFDAFTQYEKAQRMKKAALWLGGLGLAETIIGGACIISEGRKGEVAASSYAIGAVGGVLLIAAIPVSLVARGKIQDVASAYNRTKKLAFTTTGNGAGLVLTF